MSEAWFVNYQKKLYLDNRNDGPFISTNIAAYDIPEDKRTQVEEAADNFFNLVREIVKE